MTTAPNPLNPNTLPSAQNPLAMPLPSGGVPSTDDFMLVGDSTIFGLPNVTAKFYSWKGPLPAGVLPGIVTPVYDKAVVDGDLHISDVIPKLKSTAFDKITFRNVTFIYQNYAFDRTLALGWHMEADFVIDESCGLLHNVLRTVLGVKEPIIHLHAGLGMTQDWSSPVRIPSFTLDGTFPGIQIKPCQGLTLTSIGIQLVGIRRTERYPTPGTFIDYGFGVFGTLDLDVPGSVVPLELDYQISEMGGLVALSAALKGNLWTNPLGVKGLSLANVSFYSAISVTSPMTSFNFQVSATMSYRLTSAMFMGSYAAGAGFSLSATLTNFDMDSVLDIFEAITKETLDFPEVDVKVSYATIDISSGILSVALQGIDIEGHEMTDATLTFSSTGATIRGDLTSDTITFGEVDLKKAYAQVDFQKNGSGRSTDVIFGGEVTVEKLTFDAAVHLYKTDAGLQWTVFASLTEGDQSLSLSKVIPELHDTFLDMPLTQVAFVAASQDDPGMQAFAPTPYTFHQGVQLCATLGKVAPLESLLRAPASGLTLNAGWSKATGFILDIEQPGARSLHLGRGITTDPFTLRIQTGGLAPSLVLFAGFKVPVAHSPAPLDFTMALAIDTVGAKASAQMLGYWMDPFGIGQNVGIGPDLALGIDIIFEQFLTTGTPSGFGLVGGLEIGKATATFAMELDEDPMREVLSAEVKSLDVLDIVSFAKVVTGLPIPEPPNFLQFEDVKLYMCPGGAMIGTIFYPQGFSFSASMLVLGKQADISCAVNKTSVKISGDLDDLTLGPLTVRGTTGPKASLDVEIGLASQHLMIDGLVTFYDAEASLVVTVNVMPSPAFSFVAVLKFTELLLFNLNAQLVGAVSFGSMKDADFIFDALMEQHILEYVTDQLKKQFDLAKQAADEGVEAAQKKVDDAKQVMLKNIASKQKDLDNAAAAWNTKQKQVTETSQKFINEYTQKVNQLQAQVTEAKQRYNAALNKATSDVQSANNDRAAKMRDAQHQVDVANKNMQDSIASAHKRVDDAQNNMNRDFGNAEKDIADKQKKVDSLQSQINDVENEISHCNHLSKLNPRRAEVVKYGIQLAGLKTAKGTADAALTVAKKVVQGTGYLGPKTALASAQDALKLAQDSGALSLKGAQLSLSATDASTAGVVTAAQGTLRGVQSGTDAVAFNGATAALEGYKNANAKAFELAQDAVAALARCTEFLAFQAADAALKLAQHATTDVDVANKALDVVRSTDYAVLNAGEWAITHAVELVDIRVIHLSGSLRGLIGLTGKVEKPLTAHVEGVAAGHAFVFDGELDTRKTADFIASVFEKLWHEVQASIKEI